MTNLQQHVYSLLRQVPKGRVTTYKDLAQAIGTKAYRLIGKYMKDNPYPYMTCADQNVQIPCHRVVSSNGTIGGFMGKRDGKEIALKIRLLKKEGVQVVHGKVVNFTAIFHSFTIESRH